MYIIIEHCNDGSFEPVSYIGCYDTRYAAHAAMVARMNHVADGYAKWRGTAWDSKDVADDSASCYLEGEGDIFTWYIFDTAEPYDINGYA